MRFRLHSNKMCMTKITQATFLYWFSFNYYQSLALPTLKPSLSPSVNPNGNVIVKGPLQLQENQLVGNVQTHPDFILSFTLRPQGTVTTHGRIIRFTDTDNNCCNHGDRSPAIFFLPNSLTMHFSYVLNNNENAIVNVGDPLSMNEDNKVRILGLDDTIFLFVDGELKAELHVPRSDRIFQNSLNIYAGDRFSSPANALISELTYSAQNSSLMPSLVPSIENSDVPSILPTSEATSKPSLESSSAPSLDHSNVPSILSSVLNVSSEKVGFCVSPEEYPTRPVAPCNDTLFEEDFESGIGLWSGNLGAYEEILTRSGVNSSSYLKVTNRRVDWQGPVIDLFNETLKCMLFDVDYLFWVEVSMYKRTGTTNCRKYRTDCPELRVNYMTDENELRSFPIAFYNPDNGEDDGIWGMWSDVVRFDSKDFDTTNLYTSFVINGMEKDVEISIDNFKIWIPPAEYYPDPDAVCDNLLVNGIPKYPYFYYPSVKFVIDDYLSVQEDDEGYYFSMSGRRDKAYRKFMWSSPVFDLVTGCLRDGAWYHFSSKIRIHSRSNTTAFPLIRYTNYDGTSDFDIITKCPEASESLGWVECNGVIGISKEKYHTPPFSFSWFTKDSYDVMDIRNVSLVPIICGALEIGDVAVDDFGMSCSRTVQIRVDAQVSPEPLLTISNETFSTIIPSKKNVINELLDSHWHAARRTYTFSLGKGGWNGAFSNWPIFAEVVVGDAPDCKNYFDSFDLETPPIEDPATNCSELIRNGDFELTNDILNGSHWYHSGAGMEIVDDPIAGKALATIERDHIGQGLATFLDTRCITVKQRYIVQAMVKLVHSNVPALIPTCDPLKRSPGGDSCARGNIRWSSAGTPIGVNLALPDDIQVGSYGIAHMLSQSFVAGSWNRMFGFFTVDENMTTADNVAFFVDGPEKDVNIVIDNVSIALLHDECFVNGDFEIGDSRLWECEGFCEMNIISPGHAGSFFALTTLERLDFFYGPKQDLDFDCIVRNKRYEVQAWVKIVDYEGTPVDCNPFVFYEGMASSEYCPAILLKYPGVSIYEQLRVANTFGPYNINDWNLIYGIVEIYDMNFILDNWPSLYAYIGWTRDDVNLIVDDISIKPINTPLDCTQLIQNGDAEVGDARYWFLRGSGQVDGVGDIEMVQPGAGGSSYAFHHSGLRKWANMGLWQELPKRDCIPLGSVWKLTAKFSILYYCEKKKEGGDRGCPRFRVEAFDKYGANPINIKLHNQDKTPLDLSPGNWNNYMATFNMTEPFFSREKLEIYVIAAKKKNYYVDDVAFTRVS